MTASSSSAAAPAADRIDAVTAKLRAARAEIQKIIIGQDQVVDLALVSILAGGHFLLTGLPGLGKTLLVDTLGTVLGLSTGRVQCTPDLMPADIIGSEVLNTAADGTRHFSFIKGPVFNQLLMADEINRASPRTQSALLQAMQEGRVTAGGATHALPQPFIVMATQNPIEQEGTYPLPEAQLDRFMLNITLTYPARADERAMLLSTTGSHKETARAVMTAADLMAAQELVRELPIGDSVVDGILTLVAAGRAETTPFADLAPFIKWGPGPRAGQALMLAARARALLGGRLSPTLDDVAALAPSVLGHRMALGFAARAEGHSLNGVISSMTGLIA